MKRASLVALIVLAPALAVGACASTSTAVAADAGLEADVEGLDAAAEAALAEDAAPLPPPELYTDGPLAGCAKDPGAPATATVPITNPTGVADPAGDPSKFTLDMALAGYPTNAVGELVALVTTELGTIRCNLTPSVAPATVANFIGLARGTRPFDDGTVWVAKKFYDGLIFHRVVPDFVVQGGDLRGNGTGGSGYELPIENQIEEPLGTLAMASAAAPSGSQFYIVVGKGPAASYNVFGACETAVAIAISMVDRDPANKPLVPVHIQKVDIARCPAK